METSYKVVGSDGTEYGPVSLQELQSWVQEGRIGPQTQVLRSDQPSWLAASQLTELGLAGIATPPPATMPIESTDELLALERRVKSGADWFFWIAGLSMINSIVMLSGSEWGFIIGLGITQFIDAVGMLGGTTAKAIALALDAVVAGIFVLFGIFARKTHNWSFLVGMVLYGLDGLLFLLVQDFLSLGFHVFALWCIFAGFKANQELLAARRGR